MQTRKPAKAQGAGAAAAKKRAAGAIRGVSRNSIGATITMPALTVLAMLLTTAPFMPFVAQTGGTILLQAQTGCLLNADCNAPLKCCGSFCNAIICSGDADCGDADANTFDICIGPGECSSRCTHVPTGQNGAPPGEVLIENTTEQANGDQNAAEIIIENIIDQNASPGQNQPAVDSNAAENQPAVDQNVSGQNIPQDQNAVSSEIIIEKTTEFPQCAGDMNCQADSCACPASGNWEIINGDRCSLSAVCSLPGDLHIVDGTLVVRPNGVLAVPSGSKVIIEKTTGRLIVETGGKLVVEK